MATITPFLWFTGQAEEAANFYVSIFNNSKITDVSRYGEAGPGPSGSVMTVDFVLDGQEFMAINAPSDSPPERNDDAGFAQGSIALFVSCATQAELDKLWDKLAEGGKKLPCGWVSDRYGVAWNLVPEGLRDVLAGDDEERSQRAFRAMLQMGKLDIDELRRVSSA
jgi:predicted 3-demethylubiquinone-9 3-methyltransferase (glyoxalase superfamily)